MDHTTHLGWASALRVSGAAALVMLKHDITEFGGVSGKEVFMYSETSIIDL